MLVEARVSITLKIISPDFLKLRHLEIKFQFSKNSEFLNFVAFNYPL